jgi:hypothetical protein
LNAISAALNLTAIAAAIACCCIRVITVFTIRFVNDAVTTEGRVARGRLAALSTDLAGSLSVCAGVRDRVTIIAALTERPVDITVTTDRDRCLLICELENNTKAYVCSYQIITGPIIFC